MGGGGEWQWMHCRIGLEQKVRTRRRIKSSMRRLTDALNKGDEETIKGLNWQYREYA